jgi:hypothetical protein
VPVTTATSSTIATSSGTSTVRVTPMTVRSPVAVAVTGASVVGSASSAIGSDLVKVAVGCSVLPALGGPRLVADEQRDVGLDVGSGQCVSSSVIVPATAGVRMTAVVAPILASSSSMRAPTKVPVDSEIEFSRARPPPRPRRAARAGGVVILRS